MPRRIITFVGTAIMAALVLAACNASSPKESPTAEPAVTNEPTATAVSEDSRSLSPGSRVAKVETMPEYNIVTLLPPDAIPAIYDPTFLSGAEADAQYDDRERVLGIEINGDARAYSIPFLSSHEIVNDVVGGQPIAVTW